MKKEHRKSTIRWIFVLPAAFAAWSSVQLLLFFLITTPFYSNLMDMVYGSWIGFLQEFVFYAVSPYWSVIIGAKVAPKYNFLIALILATLVFSSQTAMITTLLQTSSEALVLNTKVGVFILLMAVGLASIQVKIGKTPLR